MLITTLFQRTMLCLAVLTTLGILVHDTKFDKAVLLSLPAATVVFGASMHALDFGSSAHTHVERVSLHNTLTGIPRIQPRDDHRKYLLKQAGQKSDFFGGSRVFWPGV